MTGNAPHTNDVVFMQRALTLATETIGLASPNPQVGCVLTQTPRDGGSPKIIGEGAHIYDNFDHAEIVALKQAAARGISTQGATAYVTLEPCSHRGRTGPCADALIAADISRCVVATGDPNPLVNGKGIAKLRDAGVDITVGVLQQQARELNDAFARMTLRHLPLVTLKAALSADGKLAPPAASRLPNQPHWLTGPEARAEVQRLRHASDVVLTGIGTVLADDPLLTDRTNLPRRRPLLRVILDTHLRIPLDAQLVRTANDDVLVFCSAEAPEEKRTALESHGVGVISPFEQDGHPGLTGVLNRLRESSISVLLECGSNLNGAFLRQSLVDKVVLFHTPTELGAQAIPFAQGGPSPQQLEQSLHHITRTTYGPDTAVTGYLHNPWPTDN
jgi:diaminohydroxyphosphoribosylaminopyrimidine deaminase/5-amino-6-(5-phosphoribosylamino)uracil reductase